MEQLPDSSTNELPHRSTTRAAMQRILIKSSSDLIEDGSEQPSGVTRKPDGDSVMRLEWNEAGDLHTTIITD